MSPFSAPESVTCHPCCGAYLASFSKRTASGDDQARHFAPGSGRSRPYAGQIGSTRKPDRKRRPIRSVFPQQEAENAVLMPGKHGYCRCPGSLLTPIQMRCSAAGSGKRRPYAGHSTRRRERYDTERCRSYTLFSSRSSPTTRSSGRRWRGPNLGAFYQVVACLRLCRSGRLPAAPLTAIRWAAAGLCQMPQARFLRTRKRKMTSFCGASDAYRVRDRFRRP